MTYNSFSTFRVGYRIKSYLDQQLQSCTTVNDHYKQVPLQPSSSTAVVLPTSGWISGFMNVLENGVAISRSFIYAYMVDCVSSERDPSNNFRALKTGNNLFTSGHVQSIHKAILVGTAVGESKTSFECTWLKPRKRNIVATCADVLHYIYGKTHKRKFTDADFDPRPPNNIVLLL